MLRKTLTILSLLGLLLSVGLWLASYFHVVAYSRQRACAISAGTFLWSSDSPDVLYGAFRSHGARGWVRNSLLLYDEAVIHWDDGHTKRYRLTDGIDWTSAGFSNLETRWTPGYSKNTRGIVLILPLWIPSLLLIALIFSLGVIPLLRRRKRSMLGLCISCGYDLRASKRRCPECGACFEKPKRSADCRA